MGDKLEATFYNPVPNSSDRFLKKAKAAVLEGTKQFAPERGLVENDLYIVWFAKTLQNWKALVSTDELEGVYYEVTYDGNKEQCYVDVYEKAANITVTDKHLGATDH